MIVKLRVGKTIARFVHPLDPAPRTAILVPGFEVTRTVRVFPNGWDKAAAKFSPEAVAGTFSQLLTLSREGISLTHAVICLSWDRHALLSGAQRDLLWEAFGVPIFEQYLGPANVLWAYECEAHGGLHTTPAYPGPALDSHCLCKARRPAGVARQAAPLTKVANG